MYYKKRLDKDVAKLEIIDYESDAQIMIQANSSERKVRLLLTREEPDNMEVNITPIKRPREMRSCERRLCREDPIGA